MIDCFNSWPYTKEVCGIKLESGMGLLVFILSIIWPGLSTMVAGCLCKDKMKDCIILGLLQWLTAGCCVGWLWAMHCGYCIYNNSK
mmetsp:Transcript_30242/g.21987  ORF Transcript_30242/g.21987 Transcript_30242/m.21987 type:complete len:86 (+) Transcript_30242:40-297(+)